MTLAQSTRYKLYQPVVLTDEFIITFPIFSVADLSVLIDGVETELFSVTATFVDGRATNAILTLNTAVTDVDVEIYGTRTPRRESQYLGNSPNLADNLQNDVDAVTAVQQEQSRDFQSTMRVSSRSDSFSPITINAEARAGRMVAFNAEGDGIEVGPTVEKINQADEFARQAELSSQGASAARSGAESARTQAELSALAAGAQLYDSVANGLADTSDTDVFLVQIEPGTQVYRNDAGSETQLGWLGEIIFDDVTVLLASSLIGFAESTIIRTRKEGFSYRVANSSATDHHVQMAGGVKLYVQPSVGGWDVKAFGALGDDVQDDATAINGAIQSGAQKILLTEGTFKIGSTADDFLLFDAAAAGMEFVGAGGTIKLASSTPILSSIAAIQVEDCDNLVIRNIRFDGNAANNTSNTMSATGLVGFANVLRSHGVVVSNCTVENSNNNGVYFTSGSRGCICSNNVFRNCFGTEMRVGLADSSVLSEGLFIGNTVVHDADIHAGVPKQDGVMNNRWGGDAMFIGNKVMIESTVTQVPASLIWIAQGRRTIIEGNEVISEATGSYAIQGNITADAEEIIVRNNNFKSAQGILLTDDGGARSCRTIIIAGNDIVATTQSAIQILPTTSFTVDHVVIANNALEYSNGYGIMSRVGNSVVAGNRIKRIGGAHGIYIELADNVVNGNSIDVGGSDNRGIEIYATDSVISNNRVRNYIGLPIREQGSADWNLIHGNHSRGGMITTLGANTVVADNI